MSKTSGYLTPASFKFLRDLKRNNSREWFQANKARYEAELKQPCLRLIGDLAQPLTQISECYVANPKPVGGSLFRIHRDTRFSGDKTPYKTHAGMSFYHRATREQARGSADTANFGRLDAPVFYLHIEPGESFIGGGLWHPMPESVKRVREYMVSNPASWKNITRGASFRKLYSLTGETLSRPPAGFAKDHELIEDLKRKDFVCSAPLPDEALCEPDALKTVLRHFKQAAPLLDWLCGALDLEF